MVLLVWCSLVIPLGSNFRQQVTVNLNKMNDKGLIKGVKNIWLQHTCTSALKLLIGHKLILAMPIYCYHITFLLYYFNGQ